MSKNRKTAYKWALHPLIVVSLILIASWSFAQKNEVNASIESKLIKPYEHYFQPAHEWVYTHMNKSSYLPGDDLWFTSYVLNPSNRQLNLNTSKLYVELWSPQKKLISRKILFVKEGTSSHYIHLPDSLAQGSYCFRSYTNWMRNFYTDEDLRTFITVLGNKKTDESIPAERKKTKRNDQNSITNDPPLQAKNAWDIQLLPESGTFLEGTDNVIAVKATDSFGRGIQITGKVLTADNDEIAEVSTNERGMGSFIISETTNKKYILKADLPDSTAREIDLPLVEKNGITIQVNPFRADVLSFRLQTNKATRQISNTCFVAIHANGVMHKNYRFKFLRNNSIQFRINKNELGSGILYATVFDQDLNPVAERVFYNEKIKGRGILEFKAEPAINDTIRMNVSVVDSLSKADYAKLSISLLPGATRLSQFNNSLLAESILRPAVQGAIEDPDSYFEENDFGHLAAIDLLLLTQGWRKYDWQTILQSPAPIFKYPFEKAFTAEGVVRNWLKNKSDSNSKVSLFSPKNNLLLTAPVDSAGKYKFDQMYLTDSTWVIVSASSKKDKNWNRDLQATIPEFIMDPPAFGNQIVAPDKIGTVQEDIPQLTKDVIRLPEVVVTAKQSNPFYDNIYVSPTDRILEVTKENYREFDDMGMLLRTRFNVTTEYGIDTTSGGSGYYFNTGRGSLSIMSNARVLQPIMMIDGMRVYSAQEILDLPVEYVESVAVNKDGLGGGLGASGGVIAVITRKTPFFVNNAEPTNIKKLIVRGYAAPKKYFTPKYQILPWTLEFDKYATIYWQPELITDSKKTASFSFYVPKEIQTLSIRAEGISVEGKVFLHEQKIELP